MEFDKTRWSYPRKMTMVMQKNSMPYPKHKTCKLLMSKFLINHFTLTEKSKSRFRNYQPSVRISHTSFQSSLSVYVFICLTALECHLVKVNVIQNVIFSKECFLFKAVFKKSQRQCSIKTTQCRGHFTVKLCSSTKLLHCF